MASKDKLSARQKEMLEYIQEYSHAHGRPPTIREIGQAVKISSTSVVNYNLGKLVDKELLVRDAEVSRGLRLTDKALDMLGRVVEELRNLIPIPMKGVIVASQPLEVGDAYSDGAIDVSTSLLPANIKREDLFALRVKGDSMIDAMVNENDIVVMRTQTEARNGDMVAVWLDNDTTTLKYFYNEGSRVRLQPANPTMEPIYVDPARVQVQGKVVMVIRPMA